MNYKEAEIELRKIRSKGEILFRMSISHLMDVGIRNLTDENVKYTCKEIMKQDDSKLIMTNEYQCEIVKTAAQIAKIDHTYVLAYITERVKYTVY